MAFVNAVADLAEAETHHPDFHITNYRNVHLSLTTHATGHLTLPDMIMAAKIDAIRVQYSPAWLKQHPAAAPTALPA